MFLSFVCYIGTILNVKIVKDKEEQATIVPCEITHLLRDTSFIPRTCLNFKINANGVLFHMPESFAEAVLV